MRAWACLYSLELNNSEGEFLGRAGAGRRANILN